MIHLTLGNYNVGRRSRVPLVSSFVASGYPKSRRASTGRIDLDFEERAPTLGDREFHVPVPRPVGFLGTAELSGFQGDTAGPGVVRPEVQPGEKPGGPPRKTFQAECEGWLDRAPTEFYRRTEAAYQSLFGPGFARKQISPWIRRPPALTRRQHEVLCAGSF